MCIRDRCNACGLGSGPQLSCQRCHKSYHTECLAADRLANRLHSADRPWVTIVIIIINTYFKQEVLKVICLSMLVLFFCCKC